VQIGLVTPLLVESVALRAYSKYNLHAYLTGLRAGLLWAQLNVLKFADATVFSPYISTLRKVTMFFNFILGLIAAISSALLASASPAQYRPRAPPSLAQVIGKCTVPNTAALTFDDGPYMYIQVCGFIQCILQ
jgi:hypothetical protein